MSREQPRTLLVDDDKDLLQLIAMRLTAAGSLLIGGGLAWYGTAFRRKTRNL